RLPLIAEARALDAPLDQAIAAAHELVGHQRREEVQRGEAVGLGLQDAQLEVLGHAGEAQLAQRPVDLGQVHGEGEVERILVAYSRYRASSRIRGSTWRRLSGRLGWRSSHFLTKR